MPIINQDSNKFLRKNFAFDCAYGNDNYLCDNKNELGIILINSNDDDRKS